jgi:hypothetical protein
MEIRKLTGKGSYSLVSYRSRYEHAARALRYHRCWHLGQGFAIDQAGNLTHFREELCFISFLLFSQFFQFFRFFRFLDSGLLKQYDGV